MLEKAGEIIIKIMIVFDTFGMFIKSYTSIGMVVSYVIIYGNALDKIIDEADHGRLDWLF